VLRPGGALLLAYQSGVGRRTSHQACGYAVELEAFLHHTPLVCAALATAGFRVDDRLERAARPSERHPQVFVLARRPQDAGARA